ncbi:MAG TPA: CvpA family protein [Tepidisphaeraceae bacterium]|jgi:hypothetical protein|nr:CvpA family protein [Tepidisphaeraceae bacterium]
MIFSLILFALFAVVAFFHYVQGFFSAAISAILVAIAAVVALGWYEQVAPLFFNIKFYDQAASIAMILVFAVTYFVPRLICDSFIPGNVRVPFIMDKVGAAVMGIFAGLLSTGVVAVATDALPFGPTIGMYSRFDTVDKTGEYMGRSGQMQDTTLNDVVTADTLDPDAANHVWLRQDDLVVGLENRVTGNGSLASDQSFAAVHPDLLDEFYGQRLGIQTGANHTAVTTDKIHAVEVQGVYVPPVPVPQIDSEPAQMGGRSPVDPTVKAAPDQIVLVVRMHIDGKTLVDPIDNILRFSTGAVRLVAGEPDNGVPMKDYSPVATLNGKGVALACRIDDFLFSGQGSHTIDFVFVVDRDHVMSGDEAKPPFHLPQGCFFEFKRYGVVDLSGQTVNFGPPPNPDKQSMILRTPIETILAKTDGIWSGGSIESAAPSAGGAIPQTPSSSEGIPGVGGRLLGDSGLNYVGIKTSNQLAVPINARTGNDSGTVQLANGVGGTLQHRQWQQLSVTTDTPANQLGTPVDDNIQELAVDPNKVLVQVHCTAPTTGSASQMWAWGKRVSDFALADATGHTYRCVGAWAMVQVRADRYFVCNYMNFDDRNHLQPIPSGKGRPEDVWLAFEVPAGTPIAQIRFSASPVMDNLSFKAE